MEAVGSGLGMIGLNVNYGNPTFIRDGENGYLVPYNSNDDSVDNVVSKLADAIVKYFKMVLTSRMKYLMMWHSNL